MQPECSCISLKNFRAQHPLRVKIGSFEKVDFGWVEMRQLNFIVSGPKFANFLLDVGEIVVDNAIFPCGYPHAFQRYL